MSSDKVDIKVLRELSLPNPLTPENFQELAGKAKVEKLASATQLFKAGDVDRKTIYLLEGDVKLLDSTGSKTMVRSGTENSRKPLANFQPRQHTAIAETECKVTRIDTDLLDILTTWDQVSVVSEVSDIEDIADDKEEDWMTLMLREKAFKCASWKHSSYVYENGGSSRYQPERVVTQGDEGDFYYIIRKGTAKVTRDSKSGGSITLATLSLGMAFGEEALVSGAERNASVIMETEGSLMRLASKDFEELLKEPMLNSVSKKEAEELVEEGAKYLDVRLEEESSNNGFGQDQYPFVYVAIGGGFSR